MEILTEFDELQAAMEKINLNESLMPYVNGVLVDAPAYNKVHKILDCPEMISAHKYLYDLDLDQLEECDIEKIDKLYKLGVDRGFIVDDLTDWDAELEDGDEKRCCNGTDQNCPTCGGDPDKVPEAPKNTLFKAKVPCWTVIYSAVSKDGQIKTGEAYSNAISATAAKADVKSKLSNIGYTNISILAIESCEADVEIDTFKVNDEQQSMTEADDAKDDSSEDEEKEEKEEEKPEEDAEEETEEDVEKEDSADDSSDDTEDEDASDDSEKADSTDEDPKDDASDEEDSDDKEDSEDEEDTNKEDSDEDDDNSEEDSDEEDDDSDEEDDEELDANEKAELKDEYKKVFKNTLTKCKFDVSFNDLTLEQKVKFFTELAKAWKKAQPNEFMTDKEIEQLNNVVVNASLK